jgi:hypothetical protein
MFSVWISISFQSCKALFETPCILKFFPKSSSLAKVNVDMKFDPFSKSVLSRCSQEKHFAYMIRSSDDDHLSDCNNLGSCRRIFWLNHGQDIHKSLHSTLSWTMNPFTPSHSTYLKQFLIISLYPNLVGLIIGLLPSGFPTKTVLISFLSWFMFYPYCPSLHHTYFRWGGNCVFCQYLWAVFFVYNLVFCV